MSALDNPVAVTFFRDYAAATAHEEAYTPRALAERIRTVTAASKSRLPWLKLARFGDRRTDRNSLRHDANLLAITGIEADYDGGAVTLADAAERLGQQGVACILYTSPSHTEAAPRWRVLCPLAAELPPDRRAPLLGRLNGLLGGILARESWTLSQAYFFGAVNHNPAHHVELIDGTTIDQHDDLDAIWIGPPAASPPKRSPSATPDEHDGRGDAELIRRVLTGEGYHVELCSLAARYIGRGMTQEAAAAVLTGIMLTQPTRDDRWRDRYESLPALVGSAARKFGGEQVEHRRAIARLTHRLAEQHRPAADIRGAVEAEAAHRGIPPDRAVTIAAAILHDIAEGTRRHA